MEILVIFPVVERKSPAAPFSGDTVGWVILNVSGFAVLDYHIAMRAQLERCASSLQYMKFSTGLRIVNVSHFQGASRLGTSSFGKVTVAE